MLLLKLFILIQATVFSLQTFVGVNETVYDAISGIHRRMSSFGIMQRPKVSFPLFVLFTGIPIPPAFRRDVARKKARMMRSARWKPMLEDGAFEDGMAGFLRAHVIHTLSMQCVMLNNDKSEKFYTPIDAMVFTKQWAPHQKGWTVLQKYQVGDQNGAVVYFNNASNTLALIWRPLVDNDVRVQLNTDSQKHGLFPIDFEAFDEKTAQLQAVQLNGVNISIVPHAWHSYIRLEKAILEGMQELVLAHKLEDSNFVTSGVSLGGMFSQMFAVRCLALEPKFLKLMQPSRKAVYAFNTPPVFGNENDNAERISFMLESGGWQLTRMVSQDPASVVWFGNRHGVSFLGNYSHIGPATHLMVGAERFVDYPDREKVTAIITEKVGFPTEFFKETRYSSFDTIPDPEKQPLQYFWMGISRHVMGLGMPFTFFGDAVRQYLNLTDDFECNKRIWSFE